jgi:acrylyl-CoA reductase (NADPH)
MERNMFKGILIEKDENKYSATLKDIDDSLLPEGDVTVRVAYSSLNYKDGLAITGKSPVVRRFPMIPGVDLVGTVEASSNPDYRVGDSVVLNGWGGRRNPLGRSCAKGASKGRMAGPLALGLFS